MTKLLNNVFSLKNENKHKVLNVLGLKLKFRRNKSVSVQQQCLNMNQELYYGIIFNNLINNEDWVDFKDFIPTGGAANYSFLFKLLCILKYAKPQNILEMGIGQTSKLTCSYAKHNQEARLQILEHDKIWIDKMAQELQPSENTQIIEKQLIKKTINNCENELYEDLSDCTKDRKYDLIIIDGPYGFRSTYPRTNILDLIPENLSEDFIIVLDDVERTGEQNTMKLIFDKLNANNINFSYNVSGSIKKQLVITSEKYSWVNYY